MVISRSITRNLRSTVFSLHRQELMAVTTLLPVYKQWGYVKSTKVIFPIQFSIIYTVLGNAHGSNNSNNDHYFLDSFSTTEASFNYSNMNFTGLSWIAIGSA